MAVWVNQLRTCERQGDARACILAINYTRLQYREQCMGDTGSAVKTCGRSLLPCSETELASRDGASIAFDDHQAAAT